ncbi:prophage tail protein [Bacillus phage vB_BanS_Sophrita]|uniref:Prophage tail protein n=1 Tax=Bacillus phage vB_BanS_Sophrita TaxID=2894790 RepID=A0AAE8YUF3_9CAUD|nr:prophage tail protein [Bacillus phage vB_BanS_Sophrita]UGO50797.1 prophage tail protein [Bacillus phage vB_BanS_Sophrita]
MFIDIDYNKRIQEAKFHLAKPNRRIISPINDRLGGEMNIKLGNINELTFSIPHFIEDNVPNPNVELIKEHMLIQVTMGSYKEWYVVSNIEEDGDTSDVFNVTAFSLGYELKRKRVTGFTEDAVNARELLELLLESSIWQIGTIDAMFEAMFRSFDVSEDSNVLDCIIQAGETFGALIVWDTINRRISFKDMSKDGVFKGMTVNYGRFLRSIKRTRTTDEMVTRLYVYGNEELSIASVNPTGQLYIEDFSYFMYPFERDANKNVIKESFFMSNELCHALLNHKAVIESKSPLVRQTTDEFNAKEAELRHEQGKYDTLESEYKRIEELLDMAKATENEGLIAQRKSELEAKRVLMVDQAGVTAQKKVELDYIFSVIQTLRDEINSESGFTPETLEELNLFIIESTWRDDRYVDAKELYDDGIKKFEEIRQPKVVIEVTIDNLLDVIEEQYYWDKMNLGDLIQVKYPQMDIIYMAKIIEISYNFTDREASITIANTKDLLSDTEKLVQLLYNNSSASSLVQNNKYKWDKVNKIEDVVSNIVTSEWDATKQKIIAGVNNSIEIGNRGMIVTSPDNPDEVVIIQSGVIALSQDKGETWKTAIKPDGIVAQRLIGEIIAGENLILTNSAGTFTFDKNGVQIDANSFFLRAGTGRIEGTKLIDSSNFVDELQDDGMITAYEKKMLKIEWDKLYNTYTVLDDKINRYYGSDKLLYKPIETFYQKYLDLFDYLFVQLHGEKPLLDPNNMIFTTRIDKAIFDARFKNYEDAKVEVEKILSAKEKEIMDSATAVANEAKAGLEEVRNDVLYKVEFYSPKGFTFKNGQIDTDITVTVYKGKTDVTDTIPNSGFVWKKFDKDGVLDVAWGSSHANVGKTIHVTIDDVTERATFKCDINI